MVLGVVALVLLYAFSPAEVSLFPRCIFLTLTGYECPGCGSQRAIHSLLHLRISEAFGYNPLLVLSLPYFAACLWVISRPERTPLVLLWRKRLMGPTACVVILLLVLTWGIVRNLL